MKIKNILALGLLETLKIKSHKDQIALVSYKAIPKPNPYQDDTLGIFVGQDHPLYNIFLKEIENYN